MSGIAGIIRFDGAPVEPGLVEKMTSAMSYRGPDGIHHWVKGSVALGQCMLRSTTESLEENQPLSNEEESLVLVMDGRVDNWEELRKELLGRGAVLRTRSDAELVLRAYEIWGRECLPHIDGDFALVIWDARRQEAFCVRDRTGEKPFYYHWDGRVFAFSSDLRSIFLLPWVSQKLNKGMLAEFLANEWHSRDETFWNGILRLVAAHYMTVSRSGLLIQEYWEPDFAQLEYATDAEYFVRYGQVLADSVRRSSRSHLPVAIEVSGGLDSSAIFSVAEHLRRASRLPCPGIDAYTLAFGDDERANELDYARAVGTYFGICVKEIAPSIFSLAWFENGACLRQDFPGYANGSMAQNMLSEATKSGSRAILNGVGGDEWLGGGRSYYAEELAHGRWGKLYEWMAADASVYGIRQALFWLLREGVFPTLPDSFQQGLRRTVGRWRKRPEMTEQYWLSEEIRETLKGRRRSQKARQVRYAGQRALLDTRNNAYLAYAREAAEQTYAESGLEVRRPMHTAKFVQLAFATPERLRMRGDRDKYLHVKAMQGLMPQAILVRKTKAQFSGMFRRHLDQMGDYFTCALPVARPDWLAEQGMKRLYGAYQNQPLAGWPFWVLWSIYGCDILAKQRVDDGICGD